jgi:hypothetical protein
VGLQSSRFFALLISSLFSGLGDAGEDPYGFKELGFDIEFGLKSLVVPKRLLRPRAKVVADERYDSILLATICHLTSAFVVVLMRTSTNILHPLPLYRWRRNELIHKLGFFVIITINAWLNSLLHPVLSRLKLSYRCLLLYPSLRLQNHLQ